MVQRYDLLCQLTAQLGLTSVVRGAVSRSKDNRTSKLIRTSGAGHTPLAQGSRDVSAMHVPFRSRRGVATNRQGDRPFRREIYGVALSSPGLAARLHDVAAGRQEVLEARLANQCPAAG